MEKCLKLYIRKYFVLCTFYGTVGSLWNSSKQPLYNDFKFIEIHRFHVTIFLNFFYLFIIFKVFDTDITSFILRLVDTSCPFVVEPKKTIWIIPHTHTHLYLIFLLYNLYLFSKTLHINVDRTIRYHIIISENTINI